MCSTGRNVCVEILYPKSCEQDPAALPIASYSPEIDLQSPYPINPNRRDLHDPALRHEWYRPESHWNVMILNDGE